MNTKLTAAECAWMAAMIDGEGSLFTNPRNRPGKISVPLGLCFANGDWRLVKHFKSLVFKVTGRKVSCRGYLNNGRPFWKVLVSRRADINRTLTQIEPFLIMKLPQSKLIRLLATRCWRKKRPFWMNYVARQVGWLNGHRKMPDGTYGPTASWLTRQRRGKPGESPEPVETVQDSCSRQKTQSNVSISN